MLSQSAQRPRVTELGASSFKIVGSGKPSRAVVGSGPLQTQERKGAHCSKSTEPRRSVGAAMRCWPEKEPVESKEPFRMPTHSQTELSKGSSFFMVSELGGVLDAGRLPTVKTETEPNNEMSTGDSTVGRPRVKTELSMPGDRGRDQRCPPGFEGVTPILHGYAAEVGHGTSETQRQHGMTREIHQGPVPLCSRKDFLDEAVLISYDRTNTPYIMFYNQIINLLNRCYYSDRKLALLRAACVRMTAKTIAVVISDLPGFKDDIKINMVLNRLAQRFGVSGGFLNEPEARKIRNAPKMSNTSVDAWRAFKDELTQCFVFAHSYKQPDQLEGRIVFDLALRLPTYAKQRFLDYLYNRFGCTSDPTFDS